MKYFYIILSLVVFVLFEGCTRAIDLSDHKNPTPELILKTIKNSTNKLENIDADFLMKIDFENVKLALNGEYQVESTDKFAGKLKGPFGLFAGKIIINDQEYEIQLGRGEIRTGKVDSLNFEELTGLPLPDINPVLLFYPVPCLDFKGYKTVSFETKEDNDIWTWKYQINDQTKIICFDSSKGIILSETWISENGETLLYKEYDIYNWHKGTQLASWIRVESGLSNVEIEVKYFKVNRKWKDSPFEFISGDAL